MSRTLLHELQPALAKLWTFQFCLINIQCCFSPSSPNIFSTSSLITFKAIWLTDSHVQLPHTLLFLRHILHHFSALPFSIRECIGLTWQGFSTREVAGVLSVTKAQQLPHVRAEPAAACSKRDLLQARAKPGSDTGWASGRAELRKE